MNPVLSSPLVICYLSVGISILAFLAPQKRTARVFSYILGLFVIVTIAGSIRSAFSDFSSEISLDISDSISDYSEKDYNDAVMQQTADNIVTAISDILEDEGITCRDIKLELKISDKGSIFVRRIVIYISDDYRDRTDDIKQIVNRNIQKEPDVYVEEQEAQ